jgi:hypothetical protein
LRYVHDTTTGEFVNVGVALYAPEVRFMGMQCRTTYGRLAKVFPGMDGEAFKAMMRFMQAQFDGLNGRLWGKDQQELPFEALPKSVMALAHGVLPPDDSSLQWSAPGSGLTDNASVTLEGLYERLVMGNDEKPQAERRSDDEVWRKYRRSLEPFQVVKHLGPKRISVQDDEVEFRYAWKNGVWHCLEPVSLDLSSGEGIREKAHRWLGQILSVRGSEEKFKVYLLLGEPQADSLQPAVERAVRILEKLPVDHEVVREAQAEQFAGRIARMVERI